MSYLGIAPGERGGIPVLPPVFGPVSPPPPLGDPGINPLPPFVGGSATIPAMPPADMPMPKDCGTYNQGPFCFGIDKVICEKLPCELEFFGGTIPLWGACGVLLNTLCGVVMAIILLTLLGIAFYGLTQ